MRRSLLESVRNVKEIISASLPKEALVRKQPVVRAKVEVENNPERVHGADVLIQGRRVDARQMIGGENAHLLSAFRGIGLVSLSV